MTQAQPLRAASPTGPADHGFPITPSDSTELDLPARALYVGGGGALAVTLASGAEILLEGVAGGTLLPLRVRRVHETGTTATAIVGLV